VVANSPFKFLELNIDGRTFKLRSGYQYSADGVWVRIRGGCPCMGRLARVGVSELFASQGQDVTAVVLPPKDLRVEPGDVIAKVAAGGREWPVASPIGGKVLAVNTQLEKEPDQVSRDPYDTGWLVILRPMQIDERQLFTAEEYTAYMAKGAGARSEGEQR